jgi:hypothetical protein
MRRFVGILAALGFAACSGGGGDPPPPSPTGAIAVSNASGHVIDEVYAVPPPASGWPDWGTPRNTSAVPSGGSFTVTGLAPGPWDLQVVSYGTTSVYYAWGFDLPVVANQTLPVVAELQDFTGSMIVTNGSVYTLDELYIVPSTYPDWANNWLTTPLGTDQSFHLTQLLPQTWDVRCVRQDGAVTVASYVVTSFAVTYVTCS